ncbi:MAG: hypothetical protein E6J34_21475 [Chloroflexi bacterium]|nr:MAG: hypothetical protein E6J34_21475 [Chloroflexota bacterium]
MNNEPIDIPVEDELTHSEDYPFCDDGTCPCHEDETLIAEVNELVEDGTLSPVDATDIVTGKYW